jgi:hypothetical protein
MKTIVCATILLAAAPASAQETAVVVAAPPPHPAFGVGAKVGVLLPQISTELGTAPMGGIELSFAFPWVERRVGLFLEAEYSQPTVSRSNVADPRVGTGTFDEKQTQKELVIGGGLIIRVAPPASRWNGYALLGARGYFLKTVSVGSANMNEFGENTEQSAKLGGYFALGGERQLGPGALLLEVGFGTSDLDHLITGDVSTSAIAIQLGYRFLF